MTFNPTSHATLSHTRTYTSRLLLCWLVVFLVALFSCIPRSAAETMDEYPPELVALAAELGHDPVRIFRWVYDNIEFEDYFRARKSPLATFKTLRGNQWDQSWLLVELLRISGVPARYAYTGFDNNVYVEASLDEVHYKGFVDSGEKRWIPLVPWIKETTSASSLDLFPSEDGSIADDTLLFSLDDYLADPTNKSALEVYEERLQNYLIVHHPGKTLKDIVFSERITPFPSSLLPCELPDDWRVDGGPVRFDEIPTLFHSKVGVTLNKIVGGGAADELLSATVSLPWCAGQIVSLEFTTVGGQMTPAIYVDGAAWPPDTTPQSLGTDEFFIVKLEFDGGSSQTLAEMEAGTLLVMNFDCLSSSPQRIEELKRELLSDQSLDNNGILHRQGALLATSYMLRLQQAIARTNALLHTRQFYGDPGFFAGVSITPAGQADASAFADPDGLSAFAVLPAWRIDAFWRNAGACYKAPTRRLCGKVSNALPPRSELGTLCLDLAMFTASYNEGLIFEDWLSTPGLSTIGGLMAANSDGIDIATLTVATDGGAAKIRYRTGSGQDLLLSEQAFHDLLAAKTDPLQAATRQDIVRELTTLEIPLSQVDNAEQLTLTIDLGTNTIHYQTGSEDMHLSEEQVRQHLLAQDQPWPGPRIDEIIAGLWANQIICPVSSVGYDDEIPGDGEFKAEVRIARLFESDYYLYTQDTATANGGGTFSRLLIAIEQFVSGTTSLASTFLGKVVDMFTATIPYAVSSAWDAIGTAADYVQLQAGNITNAIETTVGDPVNPVTGEFYAEELPDLSVRAPGMDLGITRFYRSKLDYHGPFGEGWAWNHSELLLEWDDGNLLFCDADQTLYDITVTAGTPPTYSYPPGTTFRIAPFTGGGHVLTRKDQTRLYFTDEGYLEKKEDVNGNMLTFGYNTNHQLVSITDTLGRTIEFVYNALGKVEKTTASGNQACFYVYGGSDLAGIKAQLSVEAGNNLDAALIRAVGSGTAAAALPLLGAADDLVAFADVAGNVTVYSYLQNQENAYCNHNMSQYWLPNGDYLKLGYYKNDTVAWHENAKGEVFNFQYSFLNRYAETWNESGYYRKVFWNDNHDVTRITTEDQTIELMEFDANHNLTARTDGNGNLTEFTYDEWRNVTSTTLCLDNSELATTSYTYTYDAVKPSLVRQIVVVDPEHRTDPNFPGVILDFGVNGKLLTRTDPPVDGVQHRLRQEHDAYGNVTATIDEQSTDNGTTWAELQRTDAAYDLAWPVLPETVTDAYGVDTTFAYDGTGPGDRVGRVTGITDAADQTVQMQYNAYGQVTQITDPLGNTVQKRYDENRCLFATTAPNGAVTANVYDVSRDIVSGAKLLRAIDPLGHSRRFTYDAVGNAVTKTDANGNTSTFRYDGMGRPLAATDALGNTVYFDYDGNGNPIRQTDACGNCTATTYDTANRKTSVTDPKLNAAIFEYDLNGNLVLAVAPDGVVTKLVYDDLNRLRKTIVNYNANFADDQQSNARITTTDYDALGRKTRETDPDGHYTRFLYDTDGTAYQPLTGDGERDPNTRLYAFSIGQDMPRHNLTVIRFQKTVDQGTTYFDVLSQAVTEYDCRGLVAQVTNGNGNATVFEYDELRRKSAETAPNGTRTEYQYDEVGNLTCIQVRDSFDALLSETRYSYNLRGERIATTRLLLDENGDETGAVTQGFGYDANGNLTSVTDEDGNTSWIYYDAANRRIATADAEGHTTLLDLDENGNMVAIVDPINNMVSSEYDENNRVISTVDATGNDVTYTYDSMGRVVTKTKHDPAPDGVAIVTQYTYTAFGQPQVVTEAVGTPDEASTIYTYTGTGQVASVTDPRGNAVTFEYDGAGHRTVAVDADLSRREFFYDANSNLTYEKRRDSTWIARVFDNVNRLTDVHLLASSTDPLDASNREQQFTYDALSRMLTAASPRRLPGPPRAASIPAHRSSRSTKAAPPSRPGPTSTVPAPTTPSCLTMEPTRTTISSTGRIP